MGGRGDEEEEGVGVAGLGEANSQGLNTQSKHHPMFELHTFGPTVLPHTRALPSEPYSREHPLEPAQLNTLRIPGLSNKSGRKSTSDKVTPPPPAARRWLLRLRATFSISPLKTGVYSIQQIEYNYRKIPFNVHCDLPSCKNENSKMCLSEFKGMSRCIQGFRRVTDGGGSSFIEHTMQAKK